MGLQLSFRKNLQFKTHFRYLSHFIPKILLFERRKFFSYILALRGNFVRVPIYENKAFLTNSHTVPKVPILGKIYQ